MSDSMECECPRCGNEIYLDSIDYGSDSQETECIHCDATIAVNYSVSVEIEGAEVADAPGVDANCPECGNSVELDTPDDESGSEEVLCEEEDCEAQYLVKWSSWGQDVDTTLLERGKTKADRDYNEESEGEDDGSPIRDPYDRDNEDENFDDDEYEEEDCEDVDFDY